MKTRPFNINDSVRVRITDAGRAILGKRDADFWRDCPWCEGHTLTPKEDAEGFQRWQLWELMQVFGPHCSNGCKVPFETTILIEAAE